MLVLDIPSCAPSLGKGNIDNRNPSPRASLVNGDNVDIPPGRAAGTSTVGATWRTATGALPPSPSSPRVADA